MSSHEVASIRMALDKDDLFKLYSIAIDEYRFEVRLNWDRTRYYLVLNMTLIGAAAALLRISSSRGGADLLILLIFGVGVFTARLGIKSLYKGREYYRKTIVQKTNLEKQLGLINDNSVLIGSTILGVQTTSGMTKIDQILKDPDSYIRKNGVSKNTISHHLVRLFVVFMIIDLFGIALITYSNIDLISEIYGTIFGVVGCAG